MSEREGECVTFIAIAAQAVQAAQTDANWWHWIYIRYTVTVVWELQRSMKKHSMTHKCLCSLLHSFIIITNCQCIKSTSISFLYTITYIEQWTSAYIQLCPLISLSVHCSLQLHSWSTWQHRQEYSKAKSGFSRSSAEIALMTDLLSAIESLLTDLSFGASFKGVSFQRPLPHPEKFVD